MPDWPPSTPRTRITRPAGRVSDENAAPGDVRAQLVPVAAVDAVGDHDDATARVRVDHPEAQARLVVGDRQLAPGLGVGEDRLDGDARGAGHDAGSGGRGARTASRRGRRARGPGTSAAAIQTVSTAIGSPLAEPEAREADRRARRPGSGAALARPASAAVALEGEQAAAGHEAALAHVLRERGQAEEAERTACGSDVGPGSVAPLDEALGDERVRRVADGHPGDAPAQGSARARWAGDRRRRDAAMSSRRRARIAWRIESSRSVTAASLGWSEVAWQAVQLDHFSSSRGRATPARDERRMLDHSVDRGRVDHSGRATVAR